MKTLANLTATATESSEVMPSSALGVLDQPAPGFMRHLHLSARGILCKRGEARVFIPAGELWRLVEQHDPEFVPVTKPPGKAAKPTRQPKKG